MALGTAGKVLIEVTAPGRSGAALGALVATGTHTPLEQLSAFFAAVGGGSIPAVVRVRTDDSTGIAAAQVATVVFASLTAGDYLVIGDGFSKRVVLTATAGTPVAGDGTFKIQTNDSTTGDNLAAAINSLIAARGVWTAANVAGAVTITCVLPGSGGNSCTLQKHVTTDAGIALTGATFTGGKDPGIRTSFASTFSDHATADDTVSIGSVTLTGKASPSGESQFAIGANATASATNLAAKINAHSKLKGFVLASNSLGVLTLTLQEAGRLGALVSVTKSCSVLTLGADSFAPATTEAWATSIVELKIGAVAA